MSMMGEFREFIMKHGVVGLAVAVVNDLVMPIVGALTPSGNWREATLTVGNIKFGIGDFAGAVIDFVIISFVIFMIVKSFIKEPPAAKT